MCLKLTEDMSFEELLLNLARHLERRFKLEEKEALPFDDGMCHPLSNKYTRTLINKLVEEYHVLEFAEPWEKVNTSGDCWISVCVSYHCKLKSTKNLSAFCSGKLEKHHPKDETAKLFLSYKNGHLILNDIFLLRKTNYDSINSRILQFLMDHPNETISRQYLESFGVLRTKDKENKDFFVVIEDLGLPNDLKRLFFGQGLSKHTIRLKNPIYQKDLDNLGIEYIDIRPRRQR